ncbi:MAG TPA: hypothetical protein VHB48_07240 [Chitinophagaceae bacterium]|jgi:glc operon protein GlcG|nr:hypothetical protein [Chitinophagaceae bacterium]
MENITVKETIAGIIAACETLFAEYVQIEEDYKKNDGNAALCIIDAGGNVYGKMFGNDKIKMRETYRIAWTKASQVHITGIRTGDFEKLVFNGEINDKQFGIERQHFIGWRGGLPVTLQDGATIAIAFSGFRGVTDVALLERAVAIAAAGGK